jgi:hypothetical protein
MAAYQAALNNRNVSSGAQLNRLVKIWLPTLLDVYGLSSYRQGELNGGNKNKT